MHSDFNYSLRLSQIVQGVCQTRGWSVQEFCRRAACGRSPSTLRRLLDGRSACSLDVAIPIVRASAEGVNRPVADVLEQLLDPQPPPDHPLTPMILGTHWRLRRRGPVVPARVLQRHLAAARRVVAVEAAVPFYLMPPRLMGRCAGVVGLAERRLATQIREALLDRLVGRDVRTTVLVPEPAVVALLRLEPPFHRWTPSDRDEWVESLEQDWARERGLALRLLGCSSPAYPSDLPALVGDVQSVLAVDDRLVLEHPRQFTGRRWFERSGDVERDDYIDSRVRRLEAMQQWAAPFPP